MIYRPEIDGLRAFAILPVMLFHAGIESFSGGYVGVDIFFVISGYLITSILISDMANGSFKLSHFYERRVRRIIPALFFVVLCSIPFAWLFLHPLEMVDFAQSIIASVSFSSNILFWFEADYFDTAAEFKPLLHTWSLAVEEQFYILFPLLLMFIWKFGSSKIIAILIAIFLASFVAANILVFEYSAFSFYLLPTRAWEILIGVFCAFYLAKTKIATSSISQCLCVLGLVLIAVAVFAFDKHTPTPSYYSLLPTVGAALIILFAAKDTFVGKLLSNKLLVGIGLISYSAYLWHQPVLVFARFQFIELSLLLKIGCIALSLLLAFFTWMWIETPFRKSRKSKIFAINGVFLPAIFSSCLLIALGGIGVAQNGFSKRITIGQNNLKIGEYTSDNSALKRESWTGLYKLGQPTLDKRTLGAFENTLWFTKDTTKRNLLLVGNSHSKDLWNVLVRSKDATSKFQIARFGSQVNVLEKSHGFFQSPNYLNADVVMIATRYRIDGSDTANLEWVVKEMLADGKKIALVKNMIEFPMQNEKLNFADRMVYDSYSAGIKTLSEIKAQSDAKHFEAYVKQVENPSIIKRQQIVIANSKIDELANKYPQLYALDRMDYICSKEQEICYSMDDKLNKYFYDYGHHTLNGADFFAKIVDEINWLKGL